MRELICFADINENPNPSKEDPITEEVPIASKDSH
jgi:hypothetical protein